MLNNCNGDQYLFCVVSYTLLPTDVSDNSRLQLNYTITIQASFKGNLTLLNPNSSFAVNFTNIVSIVNIRLHVRVYAISHRCSISDFSQIILTYESFPNAGQESTKSHHIQLLI